MDGNKIERTAVVGGGLMGGGFAQIMAQAGCRVKVLDVSDQQLEKCLRRIKDSLATFVRSDLLPQEQVEPVLRRIEFTTSMEEAVKDAQFVVEAVVEVLDVKRAVFADMERFAPVEAVLATNTSGMRVGDIGANAIHPERIVGSHFFYPPTILPLVEVGYGPATSDAAIEMVVAFWKRCGKEPVVCRKDSNGFLVNRLQSALAREAMSVVANGVASATDVDRALRLGIGLRLPLMGILEQRDWGGLDVHCAAAASIYPTLEDSKTPLPIIADKVARGEIGAKAGKGFFDWTGKDVEAIRRKKHEQMVTLLRMLKELVPEEEDLLENV